MSLRQFHDLPQHNCNWKKNDLQNSFVSDDPCVYEPVCYEMLVDKVYYAIRLQTKCTNCAKCVQHTRICKGLLISFCTRYCIVNYYFSQKKMNFLQGSRKKSFFFVNSPLRGGGKGLSTKEYKNLKKKKCSRWKIKYILSNPIRSKLSDQHQVQGGGNIAPLGFALFWPS